MWLAMSERSITRESNVARHERALDRRRVEWLGVRDGIRNYVITAALRDGRVRERQLAEKELSVRLRTLLRG